MLRDGNIDLCICMLHISQRYKRALHKMGMLQKVLKMERLNTCFSSVSKILNKISENIPLISLEDVDSILDEYCDNFQL